MRVVARTASYGRSVSPTFELLDWYDPKLPSKRSIRALGLRSAVTAGHGMPRVLGGQPLFTLGAFEPGEFPQQRLRRLGVHAELLRPRSGSGVELRWRDLDDFLASRFGMGFTVGTLIALRATSGTLFIMLVRNTAWESESDLLLDVDVLEWRRRTIPKPAEFARLNTRPSRKFPHWLMGVRWSGGSKHRNGCPL
jgi:hypothetical protein